MIDWTDAYVPPTKKKAPAQKQHTTKHVSRILSGLENMRLRSIWT